MVSKGLTAFLALAAVVSLTTCEQAEGKARKSSASRARGAYFVPPPPPYAPSILPENLHSYGYGAAASATTTTAEDEEEAPKKPENPYRKYIFTPNENDTPHVVKTNKYVSVWGKSSNKYVSYLGKTAVASK
jgi:hypothetical protein